MVDFRTLTIDNDNREGFGGSLNKMLDIAEQSHRPREMMALVISSLDELSSYQDACGGWAKWLKHPKYPSATKTDPQDHGADNMHFDDGSMGDLVRAYIRVVHLLKDNESKEAKRIKDQFSTTIKQWFSFVKLCLRKNGGIPGQASVNGDSVQQRSHELGGTWSPIETQRTGELALLWDLDVLAKDCLKRVEDVRRSDGKLDRFISNHTGEAIMADSHGNIVTQSADAKPHYRWVI